jgi:hypothetical protein
MNNRTVAFTALTVTILGTLYILYSPSPTNFTFIPKTMSSTAANPLRITLSPTSHTPPSLLVTIRNTHATSSYTFLKWDTPLDPQALNTGIFHITDLDTGKPLPIVTLKLNRHFPPGKSDLEELPPGAEVATEVVLDRPWMPEKGKFGVRVEGPWRGFWEGGKDGVGEQELEACGGEAARFGSEEVVLDVR